MLTNSTSKVTVGIKALNEEVHVEAAIRSALAAVRNLDGDVVLADSGSTDRTVEIAAALPVKVVQLANPNERSCGVGAQLAFQFAIGEYFYLLDGDMVLDADFLAAAVDFLDSNPEYAGVGGHLNEMSTEQSFQIAKRSMETKDNWRAGEVTTLDGGGLYRVAAIREAGYFADKNLHAFEEAELGVRLRHMGWKLARIPLHAVDHYGHTVNGYKLLARRVAMGYSGAVGEVLRSALGRPHFLLTLYSLKHIAVSLMVIIWWIAVLAAFIWPLQFFNKILVVLFLILFPVLFLIVRRRSLSLGVYSFASWNVTGLGMLQGIFRPRQNPTEVIEANILSDAK